tara:strand:+ start:1851 stop:2069 length:219 start_codon:yes stop_codon:yes gene_type:complete
MAYTIDEKGGVKERKGTKVAHGDPHFDRYGAPTTDPTELIGPDGKRMKVDHLKLSPEEQKKRKKLHDKKYHG